MSCFQSQKGLVSLVEKGSHIPKNVEWDFRRAVPVCGRGAWQAEQDDVHPRCPSARSGDGWDPSRWHCQPGDPAFTLPLRALI